MDDPGNDVIEACRRGDVQAFAAIVAHYKKPLFGYVYRLSGPAEAEDLVQEIFIKAYTQVASFDTARGSRFTNWLFRIARNHCISEWRKNRNAGRPVKMEPEELERVVDTRAPSPQESAWRGECADRIAAAVAGLDEPFRSAFILRHYEDMNYEDIATVMDCNPATARSRVARARERLAPLLRDLREPEGGPRHAQGNRHDVRSSA